MRCARQGEQCDERIMSVRPFVCRETVRIEMQRKTKKRTRGPHHEGRSRRHTHIRPCPCPDLTSQPGVASSARSDTDTRPRRAVLVRHVRTIQLLAFVPIDPAQARKVERERLVKLGLAYRVKRLAARSLARPPVTGTGTEQRRRKTQTHLQHLDLHARGRRRVYPAFPLVVLLSATKSTNQ